MLREEQAALDASLSSLDKSTAEKVCVIAIEGITSDDPKILFTRVNPKNEGERAHLSIPRETRDVQHPTTGAWLDPRKVKEDTSTWKKEPIRPCILRCGIEEMGITQQGMRNATFYDVGQHDFASRKGPTTIQYYMMPITGVIRENQAKPEDAEELELVKRSEITTMAKYGGINPDYVKAIDSAIARYKECSMTQFEIPFTESQLTR